MDKMQERLVVIQKGKDESTRRVEKVDSVSASEAENTILNCFPESFSCLAVYVRER